MAVAVALSRRQLLREGFRALRWTLWLREAWLEVARRRHEKALLAQTFREVSPGGGAGAWVCQGGDPGIPDQQQNVQLRVQTQGLGI